MGKAMLISSTTKLSKASVERLSAYVAALEQGWSPDTIHTAKTASLQLRDIAGGPQKFVDSLENREPAGETITLPDGSVVMRIPGFARWITDQDDEFCGAISFRWQRGSAALPPHVLGHVGYNIVPWKRRFGHATRALALLLPEVRELGLPYIELSTDPANVASQKVILSCGGHLIERFRKPAAYGGKEGLRFRITL
jgi:predicted acetyltransferase